jgi:hypothetical protein
MVEGFLRTEGAVPIYISKVLNLLTQDDNVRYTPANLTIFAKQAQNIYIIANNCTGTSWTWTTLGLRPEDKGIRGSPIMSNRGTWESIIMDNRGTYSEEMANRGTWF